MIATCPYCQNGFYFSSDLAGKMVTCSRCNKQMRAPDRRSGSPPAEAPAPSSPASKEPTAIVVETRADFEERLKVEAEARNELEKKLKLEADARAKLEQAMKELTQAKAQAEQKIAPVEEQIRSETAAKARAEERLAAEMGARREAEERIKQEQQARAQAEERLRAEIEARVKAEAQAGTETALRAEVEAQLEAEKKAKAEMEEKVKAEMQLRARAEAQVKAESDARIRSQDQAETETMARNKLERELAATRSKLAAVMETAGGRQPVNIEKGLFRLAFVLSFAGAILAGLLALKAGYVINSHFDRPVMLPLATKPHYLPLNLIGISIGGYMTVWFGYLVARFILKGFRQNKPAVKPKKTAETPAPEPPPMLETEPQAGRMGLPGMWRST